MRNRTLRSLTVLLPLALMSASCILIPEIEDRVVELAAGASTVVPGHATGTTNSFHDINTVDVKNDIDLSSVLDDNGIDVSAVKSVKLAGLSYRITVPQAGRSIDGTVVIGRGSGAVTPATMLLNSFHADASAVTGWISVTSKLDPAGVTMVNTLLDDLRKDVQGTPATNTSLTYQISGNSSPSGNTDFNYEIKLEVSIIGTVKVKVPN